MAKIIEFNPKGQKHSDEYVEILSDGRRCISVAKLRTFKGCEHYSDEEAHEIVESIKSLSLILLDIVRDEARERENDNEYELKQAA